MAACLLQHFPVCESCKEVVTQKFILCPTLPDTFCFIYMFNYWKAPFVLNITLHIYLMARIKILLLKHINTNIEYDFAEGAQTSFVNGCLWHSSNHVVLKLKCLHIYTYGFNNVMISINVPSTQTNLLRNPPKSLQSGDQAESNGEIDSHVMTVHNSRNLVFQSCISTFSWNKTSASWIINSFYFFTTSSRNKTTSWIINLVCLFTTFW